MDALLIGALLFIPAIIAGLLLAAMDVRDGSAAARSSRQEPDTGEEGGR